MKQLLKEFSKMHDDIEKKANFLLSVVKNYYDLPKKSYFYCVLGESVVYRNKDNEDWELLLPSRLLYSKSDLKEFTNQLESKKEENYDNLCNLISREREKIADMEDTLSDLEDELADGPPLIHRDFNSDTFWDHL